MVLGRAGGAVPSLAPRASTQKVSRARSSTTAEDVNCTVCDDRDEGCDDDDDHDGDDRDDDDEDDCYVTPISIFTGCLWLLPT